MRMTDTNIEIVQTDAKGRTIPDAMSDREILIEVLLHMRTIADVVEEMADSPMVKAMQGGGNPFMAMLGRG